MCYYLCRERGRDVGVLDVEESHVQKGIAEGVEEGGFGFWVAGEREVEDGDGAECHGWLSRLGLSVSMPDLRSGEICASNMM